MEIIVLELFTVQGKMVHQIQGIAFDLFPSCVRDSKMQFEEDMQANVLTVFPD